MLKKTDVNGIYKVEEGILINRDNSGLKEYKIRKNKMKKMEEFDERLNNMETSLSEIKNLLEKLIK